ncbi:VOC family protein [Nocardia miyunensis]|uniref:VOC family protein n=1 Tax=Nocardia miyunensis TaxID=282684 RepID=UPI000831800F|nr:VOC family protein [Nocardia miyunensis]
MSDNARVISLGHVGIGVKDLPMMIDFYTEVLGLTVTDGGAPGGHNVFMSADPHNEHHQFVMSMRGVQANAQPVSFTTDTLDDLRDLYHAVRDHGGCTDVQVVNHGISISFYFLDPEGNRMQVYWPTGVDHVQPESVVIDLDQSNDAILNAVRALPPRETSTAHHYGADAGKRLVSAG